ncbi:MAG: alpha-L-fucosidase [Luteolibacter sp.]
MIPSTLSCFLLAATWTLASPLSAAEDFRYDNTGFQASVLSPRADAAMTKWRQNRFGFFFHWGLYSVAGGEWKGKPYPGAAEWIKAYAGISNADYEKMVQQFNPTAYDPVKWAAMARSAGARYVTITTKHHEGFCLWPSRYTDYSVASTPYQKDLLGPFVKAFNDAGIDVYFYYSIIDWHHPDYVSEIKNPGDQEKFDRYLAYMRNQLDELLTTYPTVKGLWFDGQWEASNKTAASVRAGLELEKHLREIKPGIILNNRLRVDSAGHLDRDNAGRHFGDFDSSYERKLPQRKSPAESIPFDWEACMTVPENCWGYSKHWQGHLKTSDEILAMMANCTSLGGNFMLNFGPTETGEIRDYEQKLAGEIGTWMKDNASSIIGCGSSGLAKQDWGYITRKETDPSFHLIVFNVPVSRTLTLQLGKNQTLESATWEGKALKIEKAYGDDWLIELGDHEPIRSAFVVETKVSGATH